MDETFQTLIAFLTFSYKNKKTDYFSVVTTKRVNEGDREERGEGERETQTSTA
jgi:hypothetical protein